MQPVQSKAWFETWSSYEFPHTGFDTKECLVCCIFYIKKKKHRTPTPNPVFFFFFNNLTWFLTVDASLIITVKLAFWFIFSSFILLILGSRNSTIWCPYSTMAFCCYSKSRIQEAVAHYYWGIIVGKQVVVVEPNLLCFCWCCAWSMSYFRRKKRPITGAEWAMNGSKTLHPWKRIGASLTLK